MPETHDASGVALPDVTPTDARRGFARYLPSDGWRATAWYTLLTLAMTWPLVTGLASDIPWDLGDSLLNCWILGWNADHVLRALGGDIGALRGILDGNIFHPAPLTLAYSELLVAQTLQILPIYALTKNLILCYNPLFLSTFILSGLGAYLLTRHVTRDWRIAFVAGLFFAFVPYRWAQITHLQVISVQWMPFALYGFARWAETGSRRALAGGTAALITQNLSCGYFLIYFALFVPPYVIWLLARRRALADLRRWIDLAAAAMVTAACTVPFLLPYLKLRAMTSSQRAMSEVAGYSADTLSYFTTNPMMRVWGGVIAAYPKPEGDLFMGVTATVLALVAIGVGTRRAWAASGRDAADDMRWWIRVPRWLAGVACVVFGFASLLILVGAGGKYTIGSIAIRITSFVRSSRLALACAGIFLLCSPRARRAVALGWRSPVVAFTVIALAAAWLSLGPYPQAEGRWLSSPSAYEWLYAHVPGIDGLRVPARLAFIVAMAMTVLVACGLQVVVRAAGRRGDLVLLGAAVAVIVEGAVLPLPVNLSAADRELAPPARVAPGSAPSALATYLASLPSDAVLVEFPFGDVSWELQHVYRSTQHWRRLVNGYSGGFPLRYLSLRTYFDRPLGDRLGATAALRSCGATHVVLHRNAYRGDGAAQMDAWLQASGARPLASVDDATVFALR